VQIIENSTLYIYIYSKEQAMRSTVSPEVIV
jgi:hypothetical protein